MKLCLDCEFALFSFTSVFKHNGDCLVRKPPVSNCNSPFCAAWDSGSAVEQNTAVMISSMLGKLSDGLRLCTPSSIKCSGLCGTCYFYENDSNQILEAARSFETYERTHWMLHDVRTKTVIWITPAVKTWNLQCEGSLKHVCECWPYPGMSV